MSTMLSAHNARVLAERDTRRRPDGWYDHLPHRLVKRVPEPVVEPEQIVPPVVDGLKRGRVASRPPKVGSTREKMLRYLEQIAEHSSTMPINKLVAEHLNWDAKQIQRALEQLRLAKDIIQKTDRTGACHRVLWLVRAQRELRSADAPDTLTARPA